MGEEAGLEGTSKTPTVAPPPEKANKDSAWQAYVAAATGLLAAMVALMNGLPIFSVLVVLALAIAGCFSMAAVELIKRSGKGSTFAQTASCVAILAFFSWLMWAPLKAQHKKENPETWVSVDCKEVPYVIDPGDAYNVMELRQDDRFLGGSGGRRSSLTSRSLDGLSESGYRCEFVNRSQEAIYNVELAFFGAFYKMEWIDASAWRGGDNISKVREHPYRIKVLDPGVARSHIVYLVGWGDGFGSFDLPTKTSFDRPNELRSFGTVFDMSDITESLRFVPINKPSNPFVSPTPIVDITPSR